MEILRRDGVALGHAASGDGTPLVFVHGWACDHTFFAPQMAHFSQSHRVVAVDLRGHGASDAPWQDYTVAGFADDLAWQCSELGLEQPVIVGHGMGGTIAFDLAARYPSLPAAIMLIDSVILPPVALIDILRPVGEALHGKCYWQAFDQAATLLFPTANETVRPRRLLARMSLTPGHVAASAFVGHLIDYSASSASCTVPAAYISAAKTMVNLARLRSICPQLVAAQALGSGHFAPLEVPDQINAMIERFLAMAAPEQLRCQAA